MNEKKPNVFARMGARLSRWFRETRSELKKVVWPTPKQLVNNTMIVLVALVLVGAVIAAFDAVSLLGIRALINIFKG